MDRVGGSGGLPQIPIDTSRAQEALAGPKLTPVPHAKLPNQASEQSDITPGALAARTAAQPQVRANALKAGWKGTIVHDANTASAARHETARTIGNRTANYQQPFQKGGSITVSGSKPGAPGYIEGLLDAKTDAKPIPSFEVRGRSVALPENNRDRIAVVYEQAYKGTEQVQRSANEISHALQQATPQAATAQLGNIGAPIPADVSIGDFTTARNALVDFAHAIFTDEATKGLYSKEEQDAVIAQVIDRALDYFQAMDNPSGTVNWRDAAQLVRDNLIKIHHQQTEDHKMLTGSDHGVRHVIQSNVANTLNALDEIGPVVSPKEKLMAMQIMIDHDLGYTTDAAKGSFKSAKDHPLASTAFMELGIAQPPSSIFNEQDRKFMQEAVLAHSYPFGLDKPFNFPAGDDADAQKARQTAIAGVISVVDAMGTTGDTKCPALFREGLNFDILANLAMASNKLKDLNAQIKANPERANDPGVAALIKDLEAAETEAKQMMHGVVDQALQDGKISQEVADGYKQAIDFDMNSIGAGMMVPQFGGELIGTSMESVAGGHRLNIEFGVSENVKNLAAVFGDQDVVQAFDKAAKDLFELTQEEIAAGVE
ncbi:MAG: hypothetical protein LBF34_02510, partial [Puniceicoccales bacterium]|nr:hypothetical protein [Puniceicoccales bacterium]